MMASGVFLCVALAAVVFLHVPVTYQLDFTLCPVNCTCNQTAISCICNATAGVNITVTRQMLQNDIKYLKVANCNQLYMPSPNETLLDRLQLEEIHLSNIQRLAIAPFALAYMGHVNAIIIEDIGDWSVFSYEVFLRAKHIVSLDLRNVRIAVLPEEAFNHEFKTDNFNILHSAIGRIDSYAISLRNGTVFRIQDSIIGVIQYAGITVQDYAHVILQSNTIKMLQEESLILKSTGSLLINNSAFDQIDSKAINISNSLQNLHMDGNVVNIMKTKALTGLKGTKYVLFANNHVSEAEEDSLIPNLYLKPDRSRDLVVKGNSFVCDCGLRWLWHDFAIYRRLLETSVCDEPDRHREKFLIKLSDTLGSRDELGCYPHVGDGVARTLFSLSLSGCVVLTTMISSVFK